MEHGFEILSSETDKVTGDNEWLINVKMRSITPMADIPYPRYVNIIPTSYSGEGRPVLSPMVSEWVFKTSKLLFGEKNNMRLPNFMVNGDTSAMVVEEHHAWGRIIRLAMPIRVQYRQGTLSPIL